MGQIKATTTQNTMPAGFLNTVFTIKKNKAMKNTKQFNQFVSDKMSSLDIESTTPRFYILQVLDIISEINDKAHFIISTLELQLESTQQLLDSVQQTNQALIKRKVEFNNVASAIINTKKPNVK